MADLKFPDPHDVTAVPGTEGWERMYPYNYSFSTDDPDRTKYEKGMFWFYDGLHYPEPMYPFDIIWDEAWFMALSQLQQPDLHCSTSQRHRSPYCQWLHLHHPSARL